MIGLKFLIVFFSSLPFFWSLIERIMAIYIGERVYLCCYLMAIDNLVVSSSRLQAIKYKGGN